MTAHVASYYRDLYGAIEPEPVEPVKLEDKRLRDRDAVVRTGGMFGGQRFHKSDPEVRQNPDAFVPVVPKGLSRDDAYLALATMSHTAEDGTVTVVHAQTLVPTDHPLVRLHPHLFALPTPERRSE